MNFPLAVTSGNLIVVMHPKPKYMELKCDPCIWVCFETFIEQLLVSF